ncbi:MAG: hypothetical protein GVY22_13690 [Gammaproteobacteria bacterium]|jgi:diacylglycerol kinase family enzyme|nr:hypothetical protein [Gammaproteobacteria bacterium]
MSHAVIVVNRRAGAGASEVEVLSQRLSERLQECGVTTELIRFAEQTPGVLSWRGALDRALVEGTGRVYVLGGDGTVLAVAARLVGKPTPLAIIPLGTANLLARDLRVPLQPEQAVDTLAELTDDAVQSIDVGRVNGHLFLCASMIGLTTRLARTREAVRGRGLLRLVLRFISKGIWLLRRYPYRRLHLFTNGQPIKVKTRALVITNNPVGEAMRPYPSRARLDTGLLGIYGIHKGPLHELPRLAFRLLWGRWADDPRFFHYQSEAIRIETGRERKLTVMNDGERLRIRSPLQYDSLPAALQVVAPPAGAAPNCGENKPSQRGLNRGFASLLRGREDRSSR